MILVSMVAYGYYAAVLQAFGLLAAHLYDFLTRLWPEFGGGQNLAPTPAFLSRIVAVPFQRVEARSSFGTVFRGANRGGGAAGGSGSSTGTGTGVLPDSWKTRGKGNRLGGD